MKTIGYLILAFLFISCSTLNYNRIQNEEKSIFQPMHLTPDYDLYDLRIDIIRQTQVDESEASGSNTEDVPYHPLGFNIGNGIFIDLNDNISFLVTELLEIPEEKDFTIRQEIRRSIMKGERVFQKLRNEFTTNTKGIIKYQTKKTIKEIDSTITIKQGIFPETKIIKADTTLTYETLMLKKRIEGKGGQFHVNTFFGKRAYTYSQNELRIGKKYTIQYHQDHIEIWTTGLLFPPGLKYRIIKTGDTIFVYDEQYRGLEITISDQEVHVKRNERFTNSYKNETL